MFNFTTEYPGIIPNVKNSISEVMSQAYACPVVNSDIHDVLQSLPTAKKFSSFVSLILANYSKELWNQKTIIFKAKNLVFDRIMNCWEFTTSQKVVGESVYAKKSPISGKFTKYTKTTILLNVNVRFHVVGTSLIIETYLPNTSAQQIVPVAGNAYSKFLLSEDTLRISENYYRELKKTFTQNLSFLKDKLASYKVKDGDLLLAMSLWNKKKYQTLSDYRCISQVYSAAIRKFPLFKAESYESQKEILFSALRNAKAATIYERHSMASSDFSKALYFELITHHLDQKMVTGKFTVKTLKMQKWGREHFGNISRTLLYTPEQIESFDYTKVTADQLVWVVYDNANYAAYEMFNMLLPSADDILQNTFNTSVQVSDIDNPDEVS